VKVRAERDANERQAREDKEEKIKEKRRFLKV